MTLHLDIPTLETERLILRAITLADFPAMRDFFACERSQFVGGPLSANMAWYGFASDLGQWALMGFGAFAIEEKATGNFAGQVYLNNPPHFPENEIGWILLDGFEGKGYATEAALAARQYAYDVAGWKTAVSYISKPNTGSIRVAERLGAKSDPEAPMPNKEDVFVYRHPAPFDVCASGAA